MSSCPSNSDTLPLEKAESFRKERHDYIREDFKGILRSAVLQYMASKDFLPDLAFNVDRKTAIIEGIEELIQELKENP